MANPFDDVMNWPWMSQDPWADILYRPPTDPYSTIAPSPALPANIPMATVTGGQHPLAGRQLPEAGARGVGLLSAEADPNAGPIVAPPAGVPPVETPPGIGYGGAPVPGAPGGMTPSVGQQGGDWNFWERVMGSLEGPTWGHVENAGRGRRALGRFGILNTNLPSWSRAALGREVSEQEFLQSPEVQRAIFQHRFGGYLSQYGVEGAANAWFTGTPRPRADHPSDILGTSPAEYMRRFRVAMARERGRGAAPQAPEFTPTGVELGSEFSQLPAGIQAQAQSAAYGAYGPNIPASLPAAVSPRAAAIAPGLAGPPPQVARQGIMGLFDLAGIGGRGQPTVTPADYAQNFGMNLHSASAQVYARGQELRLENPDATPDQLARMLIRDPVWGRNAVALGANAPTVVREAINPPKPQEGGFTLGPGQTRFNAAGTQIAQGGPPQLPAQVQTFQWLLGQTPEVQSQFLNLMRAPQRESDREQAMGRIRAIEARGGQADPNDLLIAGWIQKLPILHPVSQAVIGERFVDARTGREISNTVRPTGFPGAPGAPAAAVPPAPVAGGPPALPPGPPPPGGGAGGIPVPPAGIGFGATPWRPGQPISPEMQQFLMQGGGVPGQFPDASSVGPSLFGPEAGVGGAEAPSSALDTMPRDIKVGDRTVRDAPGLSVTSSLIDDPAKMFLAVGPIARLRTLYGQFGANFVAGLEESNQTRAALLQSLSAAYARWHRGIRLAGEFTTQQQTIPTPGLGSNPGRGLSQAILLRESLIKDLELVSKQAYDQTLPAHTKTAATDRLAEIQGFLQSLPTLESMIKLRDDVMSGKLVDEPSSIPGMDSILDTAGKIRDTVTGKQGGPAAPAAPATPSRVPADINDPSKWPPERLLELGKKLPSADRAKIIEELRRRVQEEAKQKAGGQ